MKGGQRYSEGRKRVWAGRVANTVKVGWESRCAGQDAWVKMRGSRWAAPCWRQRVVHKPSTTSELRDCDGHLRVRVALHVRLAEVLHLIRCDCGPNAVNAPSMCHQCGGHAWLGNVGCVGWVDIYSTTLAALDLHYTTLNTHLWRTRTQQWSWSDRM